MAAALQKSLVFHSAGFDYAPLFSRKLVPHYVTDLGVLFSGDCLGESSSPWLKPRPSDRCRCHAEFNLNKEYGKKSNGNSADDAYLEVVRDKWPDECIRVLKPGGSCFIYNLPKWEHYAGARTSRSVA